VENKHMVSQGPFQFVLTLKGSEELTSRTYHLDVKLRNILFLIQKGSATFESILQNSIFPADEVVERVRSLINEKFIALSGHAPPAEPVRAAPAAAPVADAAAGPTTGLRAPTRIPAQSFPSLDPGASPSQARFILCDFCLDLYGTKGQERIDAINGASGIGALQRLLDDVYEDLRARGARDAIAALAGRVNEINESKV
jgi:hypothetical protein